MVFTETLLGYPDCKISFMIHTTTDDKQLGAFISQNNKPIEFFSRVLSNSQRNYTTNKKELLRIF